MAGGRDRGCRGQVPIEEVPHRGRNIRDEMIEDLQRQVAELTQRLMAQILGRRGQAPTEEVSHLDHYHGQVPAEEVPHLDHDEEDYYSRGQIPAEEVPKYFSCLDCDEEFYNFNSGFDEGQLIGEEVADEVEEYGEPVYDEYADEEIFYREPIYEEYEDEEVLYEDIMDENTAIDKISQEIILYENNSTDESIEVTFDVLELPEEFLSGLSPMKNIQHQLDLIPGSSLVNQRKNISVAEALSRTFSILSESNSRTSSFQLVETDAGGFQGEDAE